MGAWRCSETWTSGLRLIVDMLQCRLARSRRLPNHNARRLVRLKPGLFVTYRLNHGDLQALREVIFEECYRPARPFLPTTLVDLGANIGLTSLWLWKRFGFSKVIAIEPDSANVAILKENFRINGVPGTIGQGVVGPPSKTALFACSAHSVLGRIDAEGIVVDVIDLDPLLQRECVGLVKMDIEGAEQDLVAGSVQWLTNVQAIIVELHPTIVDCRYVVSRLVSAGLQYVPANSEGWANADFFFRPESVGSRGQDTRRYSRG